MTSWYGKTASKQIQSLLESKPKLSQLLAISEFLPQLKAYNSKLLDYITNHPSIISEAVLYLTVPPHMSDSHERKYKLPLQVIEMIQTETTCVLNGFFKQHQAKEITNFDQLFLMLEQSEVLPLLAGYFFRTNLCLLNNRYKEVIDRIYSNTKIFQNLINHSEHMAISNTIQLFLNLDINKTSISYPQKLAIKIEVVKSIIKKIAQHDKIRTSESSAIVENLCSVLIETIDKYYLILDGKQMIQAITDQRSIQIMMNLIRNPSELSSPAFSFFISLINYYSFSSFNSDEIQTNEVAKKNAERLQNQPMIIEMVNFFQGAMEKIMNASSVTLYHYKLLEVLCHCISISSMKIFKKMCDIKFFSCLIHLLFSHEHNNILHMLIEKSFYHIFISERKIYEDYKKHLFCDLDIIDITVSRVLKMFPEDKFYEHIKKKAYFGHFMRILKIYSGIQPVDEKIINSIKAKTIVWNKISQILIKPYEGICFKELGSYQNIPNPTTQQFVIKKSSNMISEVNKNTSAILEIEKEQLFPLSSTTVSKQKQKEEEAHKNPFDIVEPMNLAIDPIPQEKDLKKTQSFKEFMSKKKVEAQHEIKAKRSLSQDKKLSNTSRGKMTNPSPSKKNSWKDDKSEDKSIEDKEKQGLPKVPISRRNISPSTNVINRENRFAEEDKKIGKAINMEEIRKIKVIQIDPPRQKKYRKADEKDKLLLDFLGISV